jgi:hypothetical protein
MGRVIILALSLQYGGKWGSRKGSRSPAIRSRRTRGTEERRSKSIGLSPDQKKNAQKPESVPGRSRTPKVLSRSTRRYPEIEAP